MTANHGTMNGTAGGQISRPSSAASSTSSRRQHGKPAKGLVGQASWISSVINLVNTIVGAGVLAMPLALSHMGILLGTFIIAWAGITAGFGLYLQSRCARYLERGSASFFALSQMTYPRASVIFDGAIAIKCFGVGVSYLIIIGDLMPGVVQGLKTDGAHPAFLLDRHFWVTAFMLVVTPFAFLRRIDSLKYTSIVALFSIGYLVILVITHYARGDTLADRGPIRVIDTGGAIPVLSSFPVIVFAYTCHQNMFSIVNEMKDPSAPKMTSVLTTSIGSAFVVYLTVAITGYLSFGNNVSGNVVGMYAPSVASTIGKAAIVVLVMFSYALQVHPCRASVDAILKYSPSTSTRHQRASSIDGTSPSRRALLRPSAGPSRQKQDTMSETRFAIITTVIVILSYIVAMTVSSLDKVLAYVGSTGSTTISFILPGLFYYQISDPESPFHQKMLKEDDDEDSITSADNDSDHEGVTNTNGARSASKVSASTALWRRQLLRRASLALAVYGICVMVTCLITNTIFLTRAAH